MRSVGVARAAGEDPCRTCGKRDFPWLDGRRGATAVSLCGRNAVQLAATGSERVSLAALRAKLEKIGPVSGNDFLLRFEADGYRITVFADGRTIIGGTDDVAQARVVHARYIGG
jgi:adenylyltransferase/sulfurtransferase